MYYPKDPKARAIVNHRLCFNLAMYYRNISEYTVIVFVFQLLLQIINSLNLSIILFQLAPIFFDYKKTPLGLKKMKIGLDVFENYLERENSIYAAGGSVKKININLML